jgi:sterol desaturase/sphingolipid hydroxylase (fatty acid hydroxylase superfamily)
VFVFCFILERVIPGWPLPHVRTWPLRVLLVNGVQLGVILLAGFTWERWLSSASVFQLSEHVSPAGGGLIAYFIATFVFYWRHRWRHEYSFRRGFTRSTTVPTLVITSHNSAKWSSFDLASVYTHSFGLHRGRNYLHNVHALGEFFYHTNVKTPRWVGFFFQRPEMHRIHHQHNRHKNNYGDITWWDMLFGTYENPKEWVHTCGFDDMKEQQLLPMLAYKDVHKSA